MKKYNVLVSSLYGEWVEVKANNEEEAIKKVDNGDWYDEDIQSSKLIDRQTTGDIEEISDE
jgi:hypothetical protein|tara:strand:+ start:519 stop:701 length:183 start_codon:yes stop_codon:yes gene_type:complete